MSLTPKDAELFKGVTTTNPPQHNKLLPGWMSPEPPPGYRNCCFCLKHFTPRIFTMRFWPRTTADLRKCGLGRTKRMKIGQLEMMKKITLLLALASVTAGATAADVAGVQAQSAVEGQGCRHVNGMARTKDGKWLACVDSENVWKLASDPTAKHLCQKNGKTTNPDGTTVQCRIEGGKVVPISETNTKN